MPRRETQQQKNSRPMRDDCFYWCARGACPPCAAAGRGSGAPPALHSLPLPFKSRGSKRKMTARRRSFPFWCARGTCPALRRRPPRVASLPRRLAKRPRVQVPRIVKNSRPRRTTVFTGARGGGLARRARRRVAALERPRRSIHSRSRSSPRIVKNSRPIRDDCFCWCTEYG